MDFDVGQFIVPILIATSVAIFVGSRMWRLFKN